MRKYRLLFFGSLLLGIMVIVLTGSRFWFEDGLLGSETLERLRQHFCAIHNRPAAQPVRGLANSGGD